MRWLIGVVGILVIGKVTYTTELHPTPAQCLASMEQFNDLGQIIRNQIETGIQSHDTATLNSKYHDATRVLSTGECQGIFGKSPVDTLQRRYWFSRETDYLFGVTEGRLRPRP